MGRIIKATTVLCLLVASVPAASGQSYNPYRPGIAQEDPRARRAIYERAVAYAGEKSRPLVEAFGDEAVAAILACTQEGARKLVEFTRTKEFERIPKPTELLKCIAQRGNGDDVVLWLIQPEHARLLTDIDSQDAFMSCPLDIVFSLKSIEQAATENRARRLGIHGSATGTQYLHIPLTGGTFALALCLMLITTIIWKRRRAKMM
jgi:hypothetical protein